MLGKSIFANPSGGQSSGGNSGNGTGTIVDGDKIVYTITPDVLIENGKVYFDNTGLNAVIQYSEGKLYAEGVERIE